MRLFDVCRQQETSRINGNFLHQIKLFLLSMISSTFLQYCTLFNFMVILYFVLKCFQQWLLKVHNKMPSDVTSDQIYQKISSPYYYFQHATHFKKKSTAFYLLCRFPFFQLGGFGFFCNYVLSICKHIGSGRNSTSWKTYSFLQELWQTMFSKFLFFKFKFWTFKKIQGIENRLCVMCL